MSSAKAAGAKRRAKPVRSSPKPARGLPAVGEQTAEVTRLAAEIDRSLASGKVDVLSPESVQKLMTAICRLYSAQIEAGGDFLPVASRSLTSTDVMTIASGLLKSSNLAVFELGMWQSWTGR
jgi:hypothetical protein